MIAGLFERMALRKLAGLTHGRLTVRHRNVEHRFGDGGHPVASLTVLDPAFFRAVALGGHIGAAESFVRDEWASPDLAAVVELLARNRETLDGLERGLAQLSAPLLAPLRLLNRNTRSGSARNIQAHYDLGNDFFAAFLDETLTYSAALFEHPDATLAEASAAKYDRLCRLLHLSEADHVVEIGTGWGGFAIHAATHYGCRVTTTTISREQHSLASQRVEDAGVGDRVELLMQDYRDLRGEYDKLVSIEMIEAVGHQYLDTFFQKCADLIGPRGLAAIQAITILDDWYDPRQRQVDFIKKYIFPGSFIPSMGALRASARTAELKLVSQGDLTPHYAETLRRWDARFNGQWPRISAMGFDEAFRKLWTFYFAYCRGGFSAGVLRSNQLLFAGPSASWELPQGLAIPSHVYSQEAGASVEGRP